MTMMTSDFAEDLPGRERSVASANPLRPVMITVFAAKLAVAAVLVSCAAFAPTVSAETSYFLSR